MRRRVGALVLLLVGAGCGAEAEPMEDPVPLADAPAFEFPLELWDLGAEGETVLMLHVTEAGQVDSVRVHMSSGHAGFDKAALDGAWKLSFTPARHGGRHVATWARLPVRFLRDSAVVEVLPLQRSQ